MAWPRRISAFEPECNPILVDVNAFGPIDQLAIDPVVADISPEMFAFSATKRPACVTLNGAELGDKLPA